MDLKKLALAVATGTTLLSAAPVFAQSHWRPGYDRHVPHRHHHYRPQAHYYAPPAPVYYAPAPYYYAPPPRPVIYGTLPIGDSRVRIGLQF